MVQIISCLVVSLFIMYAAPSTNAKLMVEICDNAIDDDGDGLIDINDPDCECPVIEPKSLIPNPSFEDRKCCPLGRSQLNCAETWIQASEPTTDYLHTCGWMGWEQFPPPTPFPDGNGCMGFRNGRNIRGNSEPTWKEYAGACLLGPLKAGVSYKIQFHIGFADALSSPALDVVFFGNTNCENLPFGVNNERLGCPTKDTTNWVQLGSVFASGNSNWVQKVIEIVPKEDIYAIAIGPDCGESFINNNTYYFFDNLILDETRAFDFRITPLNHPCSDQPVIQVPEVIGASYQWYKDGVAIIGANQPAMEVMDGPGAYQVRILSEEECKITRVYEHRIPTYQSQENQIICFNDELNFLGENLNEAGTYVKTIKNSNNCDSTITLNLEVQNNIPDTISPKIFRGEQFEFENFQFRDEGMHIAPLQSSIGCDSSVFVNLSFFEIYAPNAFSPNGDGVNDYFNIYGNNDLEEVLELKVFDRWGNLIYSATSLTPSNVSEGWDGSRLGELLGTGVYIYTAMVRMFDGQTKKMSGEVLLVR